MTQPALSDVLTRIADEAHPVDVADDTWRRGVRRRRSRVAGAVLLAVAAGLAGTLVLLNAGRGAVTRPAGSSPPVVPSTVYSPVTGEDTVTEAPPGPAAILVSGDHELRGSDVWGWEGRSLVVGQDGTYRLARTVGESTAGLAGGLLLSPDGRYLAGPPWMEGATWPDDGRDQTAVLDLSTGAVVQYDGGNPVAWAPDGASILVHAYPPDGSGQPNVIGSLRLLSVRTGQVRSLPDIRGRMREGNVAAFSPDGTRLVLATADALYLVDPARDAVVRLAGLTARDRLAGPGAWLPDGRRIALYSMSGCTDDESCDETGLGSREFHVRYLDADTGQPAAGPPLPPARGQAARLLGWQRDGAAVVAVYSPEAGVRMSAHDPNWSETDWWAVGGVELMRFGADGARRRLVDLPGSALFVDVPANLLDRFGGPSPSRLEGAARWLLALYWPAGQVAEALVVAVAGVILARWLRRRSRRT